MQLRYLLLLALKDANDAIIKMKNGLDLPEIHRNDPNQLHTASDRQKILNKKNSLNAAFFYKHGSVRPSMFRQSIGGKYGSG